LAVIFDLDNCLAAADEPGEALLAPVFGAVRAANDGTLTAAALDAAFHDCWFHAFDWAAARHGFSHEMRRAGWDAFRQIEVRGVMRGYGDLDLLPTLGDLRFLVTSGFRRLQESKVRALEVAHHFDEVIVDALDEPDRRGKKGIFADIIERHRLDRSDVLVVGDNPESELAAARQLDLPRVQILRPGVSAAPDVRDRVPDLAALRLLLAHR
jgi:putative hydrolase of the HAD superfamily